MTSMARSMKGSGAFNAPLAMLQATEERSSSNPLEITITSFFFSFIILIAFSYRQDQINLMPFLIPFSILGVGAIDNLKRGAASALNWFGILIFGFIGIIIWVGWFASITTFPNDLYQRIYEASANYSNQF